MPKINNKTYAVSVFLGTGLLLSPLSWQVSAAEGGASLHAPGVQAAPFSGVLPGEGVYLKNEIYSYEGSSELMVRGGMVNTDIKVDALANLFRTTWVTDYKIGEAQYAFAILVPVVGLDISGKAQATGIGAKHFDSKETALGDVSLTPLILGWHNEEWHYLFNTTIYVPVGDYDTGLQANTGKNRWGLDASGGTSYIKGPFEASAYFGITYNFENRDTDYKSGTEVHLDFSASMALDQNWRVGLAGYGLKQLTADSGDGALLGDFEGQVLGLGPQVVYNAKVNENPISFGMRYFKEFSVENRNKGETLFLMFTAKI